MRLVFLQETFLQLVNMKSESLTQDQISPQKYWNFSNIIEYSSSYDGELRAPSWGPGRRTLSSCKLQTFEVIWIIISFHVRELLMVLPSPKWERPKYWRETHLATSLVTRIERSSHRTISYWGEIVFTFLC